MRVFSQYFCGDLFNWIEVKERVCFKYLLWKWKCFPNLCCGGDSAFLMLVVKVKVFYLNWSDENWRECSSNICCWFKQSEDNIKRDFRRSTRTLWKVLERTKRRLRNRQIRFPLVEVEQTTNLLFLQIFLAGLTDAVPGSNEFADQGANPIWKVTNQNFKNNQTNKPYLVGDVYSINSKVVIAQ